MWEVTLYKKTGMDSVNTLSSPAYLDQAVSITVPALDILQGEFLTSVNVKATSKEITDVDFMKLTDTEGSTNNESIFYSVSGYTSSSVDVQTLYVLMDSWLTLMHRMGAESNLRAAENLVFLDGITTRHHVPKEDDIYGAFTEPDPLLTPSRELTFVSGRIFAEGSQTKKLNVIESTIDLVSMADENNSTTYTDPDGSYTVTVPNVSPILSQTTVGGGGITNISYSVPGAMYFDGDNPNVKKGIAKVRALGVEHGILNSIIIPDAFVSTDLSSIYDGRITNLIGKSAIINADNIEKIYADVDNTRVLYGELNRIEIVSVPNGTRMSFRPEEITMPGTAGDPHFVFQMGSDVRTHGRPYFGPAIYHGLELFDTETTGRSAKVSKCIELGVGLPGMEWANLPLVYTGSSGSTLNEIDYQMSTNRNVEQRNLSRAGNVANTASGVFNTSLGLMSSLSSGDFGSSAGQLGNFFSLGANAALNQRAYEQQYKYNSFSEILNYVSTNEVVTPEVHFPRSETTRDLIGNELFVIQYRPQDIDLHKMDYILTMYGYKDTAILRGNMFLNRREFNYVAATGVSIGISQFDRNTTNKPKWLREAASAQISAGIRVWHGLPQPARYYDRSNV